MAEMRQALTLEPLTVCPNGKAAVHCEQCRVRSLSLCGALETDELFELDRLSRPLNVAARETIFEQDELADSVFNITSGSARLYRLLPDGRRQIVGFALPGDFLGLALTEKNTFSADALTPLTACQFSRQAFSDFLDSKPHLLRKLHAMASHELSMAQEQMVILGRRTAEEKVASFLIGLRKRWARLSSASVTIPLPMTRQDIGDFLGLTVETVSRMLTRLARDKTILIVPDGVRLLDVKRIEAMAES